MKLLMNNTGVINLGTCFVIMRKILSYVIAFSLIINLTPNNRKDYFSNKTFLSYVEIRFDIPQFLYKQQGKVFAYVAEHQKIK